MKLYNDYSSYLKSKYGCKVYRIGLNAGLGCPNRCVYCNDDGSGAPYINPNDSITDQLKRRITYLKDKGAEKFIAYFQAFTNTYAPIEKLQNIYDQALPFKEIVGISIGTRPDTIDEDKVKLISSYKDRYEVWMEYGLQSAHDRTLKAINRGHDFADFVKAVNITKKYGLLVSAHVILGLPGETRDDMMITARKINGLGLDGVKIHLLHILRGSALEKSYNEGEIRILSQEEYVELACDFLENLSRKIVIQRLTGQGRKEDHIAPLWALDKIGTINKIRETLEKRGTYQGIKITNSKFQNPNKSFKSK